MAFKWVNLYPMALADGFVYFKAYINNDTNYVVGWITRYGLNLPYAYNCYWVDNTGKVVTDTRGTWQHATYAVEGAVASLQSEGIHVMATASEKKTQDWEIYHRLKATMDAALIKK